MIEKAQQIEAARRKQRMENFAARRSRNSTHSGQRVEIWIPVNGLRTAQDRVEVDENDDDADDVNSLPMVEVKSLDESPVLNRKKNSKSNDPGHLPVSVTFDTSLC